MYLHYICFFSFVLALSGSGWTKRDEAHALKLTDAVFGKKDRSIHPHAFSSGEPEAFMDPKRVVKRDVNIPIYPWSYPLISWGFVNKDLNFALSYNFQLLESRDSLMTFQARSDVPTADQCYEVQVNPLNRKIVLLLGIRASWLSTNGGVSFERLATTQTKQSLSFHPKNEKWATAFGLGSRTLFLTQDLGASWRLVGTGVSQFDWCHAGENGISENTMCLIKDDTPERHFMTSSDLGLTWKIPLDEKAEYFKTHDRFITLVADYQDNIDLYVSSNNGISFQRALLPESITVGTLQESQYIEDDYGVIWIVVSHSIVPGSPSKGNLYVSDADGYKFTLALRDVHTINNWWDVEMIRSIEGTFLANVMISQDPLLVKTFITWDNGDKWYNLQAPSVDSNGTAISCSGTCSLNLFGVTTWLGSGGGFFGPVYSDHHAVGMILGTGSASNYLPQGEPLKINTYLSRDGGLSWDELMKGSSIYEYGDFGGLLVLAPNTIPTNLIYYSLDSGLTFSPVVLPEVVNVLNIVVASTQNERFIIIATDEAKQRRFWGIDFSMVHERNCTETDYETWEPHDGVKGPKCVLGHDVLYRRRKRSAACYTDDGLNKIVTVTNCPCTENDYECDFGFEKTTTTGTCATQHPEYESFAIASQCLNSSSTYLLSTGYRKLPGDSCVNEITKHLPISKACPLIPNDLSSGSTRKLSSGTVLGIVVGCVILVLFAGAVGFLLGMRDERFRKKFPWIKAPAWVHVGYSNELVEETTADAKGAEQDLSDVEDGEENVNLEDEAE
eukprot:TRINITY_DN1172_c0_g1_i1.p1 TRINITY_DN1172_c0_g1~~TRINITY_DN1172_c0_g1_i1.p1  ORF type:complete len:785 (-),score=146.20 TRINITY_DN1172_c0_g1_i1:37-2391(-)